MTLSTTANGQDEEEAAYKKAYMQYLTQMPEYEKPYEADTIIKDIGNAKGFLGKVGAGIGGAIKYLGTGEGKKVIGGLVMKNPTAGLTMYGMGQQKQHQEQANKMAYQQAIQDKMKELGENMREGNKQKFESSESTKRIEADKALKQMELEAQNNPANIATQIKLEQLKNDIAAQALAEKKASEDIEMKKEEQTAKEYETTEKERPWYLKWTGIHTKKPVNENEKQKALEILKARQPTRG